MRACRLLQIQADIGEGHPNIIKARAALLTEKHLALVLEYAPKGSLTDYVADRWETAKKSGIFMAEEEARYFFRVGPSSSPRALPRALCFGFFIFVTEEEARYFFSVGPFSSPRALCFAFFIFVTEEARYFVRVGPSSG